jgi:hypothetical protein
LRSSIPKNLHLGPQNGPEVKTAKNSKLPKLSENCFEPVGKGGWPPISTWITMLTNPFPHGKNLTQSSSSTEGGSQGPPMSASNPSSVNVYMMKGSIDLTTRKCEYIMINTSEKCKEVENPSLPRQIEKTLGETMTCIPKGAFSKASHNPNARASQNYSMVEDLSQSPYAMSALKFL